MKLVRIDDFWINPEHVVSIRVNNFEQSTIVQTQAGTTYVKAKIEDVIEKLTGEKA